MRDLKDMEYGMRNEEWGEEEGEEEYEYEKYDKIWMYPNDWLYRLSNRIYLEVGTVCMYLYT